MFGWSASNHILAACGAQVDQRMESEEPGTEIAKGQQCERQVKQAKLRHLEAAFVGILCRS